VWPSRPEPSIERQPVCWPDSSSLLGLGVSPYTIGTHGLKQQTILPDSNGRLPGGHPLGLRRSRSCVSGHRRNSPPDSITPTPVGYCIGRGRGIQGGTAAVWHWRPGGTGSLSASVFSRQGLGQAGGNILQFWHWRPSGMNSGRMEPEPQARRERSRGACPPVHGLASCPCHRSGIASGPAPTDGDIGPGRSPPLRRRV
jgi:hypothetical protein